MIGKELTPASKTNFSKHLLKWWKKNKRDFPWRRTKNPYAVLVAEMLLRKTTALQVERIYNNFISKFPNPKALSNTNENKLKNFLKPLGMEYRRAKLPIELGKTLMETHNGKVPSNQEDLLKLPGVGLYSANAVMSFCHGQNAPTVDTNFIRVIQRVFGLKSKRARARDDGNVWKFAQVLVPKGKSRNFNLAVLDFAAKICKPRNPKCDSCPLNDDCLFYKSTKKGGYGKSL